MNMQKPPARSNSSGTDCLDINTPAGPHGISMKAWTTSYRAAHDARLLSQTLQLLNQRIINLQPALLAAKQEAERETAGEARKV
jgi:hypothetical protein